MQPESGPRSALPACSTSREVFSVAGGGRVPRVRELATEPVLSFSR